MLTQLTHHLKLPDPWQHSAVNYLRAGSDVIVSAPTGAGKTFIFELLVKSGYLKRQAVYTVPTRALANDKHAEWKEAGWNVGLATGDLSENIHAPVLVATLETQLERLITGQGPALLVLDEYQMISDPARGPHYEGAIILAPKDTQLLLLSGSVENPTDVAEWMRRLGRKAEVVTTQERPVPLEDTPVEVLPQRFKNIEGWWPKLAISALVADLAPLLIFAPRRRDAEKIAEKLAAHLPQGDPLQLTNAQRALAGKDMAALLEKRIAYHHSGLPYALRAGLVEPLAKAGQLRVIVSTMGLAAGINFSVRSVHVASTSFHDGISEQQLTADELLQMFGRAGRRGLDERGYVLTTRDSPSLADARPARVRRGSKLSWPLFLRVMRQAALEGRDAFAAASDFATKLFSKAPPMLGLEPSEDVPLSPAPARTVSENLFNLHHIKQELFNSQGVWEEVKTNPMREVPLGQAWLAQEGFPGPALASSRYVNALGPGRLCKLGKTDGFQLYGKEVAIGLPPPEFTEDYHEFSTEVEITPTQALRKLLGIPKHVVTIRPEKIQATLLPKLAAHFPGASFAGLRIKDRHLYAIYDFSPKLVKAMGDSHGRMVTEPELRAAEREQATDIAGTPGQAHAARAGTAVHAWRTLGLIESNGVPTRRGVIFSYFQHGEGLAIAAALEDETYPVDEMLLHLANLRGGHRMEYTGATGSERLAAACRAAYGLVNHHGYLEAGLPVGYRDATAELLGLILTGVESGPVVSLSKSTEGDLTRAYVEWLSLLRHITHAPAYPWPRWQALQQAAAPVLKKHLEVAGQHLHPALPELTPKQKHHRPLHYLIRA